MNLPDFEGKILIKAEGKWDAQRVRRAILLALSSFSKAVDNFLLEMEQLVEAGTPDQIGQVLKSRSVLHPIRKAVTKTGLDLMSLVEAMSQVIAQDPEKLADHLLKVLGSSTRTNQSFRIKDPDDSFSQIIFCNSQQQELFNTLTLLFIIGVERSFDGRGEIRVSY